ncbi:dihydrodipicolinate synthase family protein [Sinobaca sp. H24]|uniref:dihydrodipicolinate synthase family protein n=1 Tax=Sinobaca sp. H24 TaxID=2923376 RepID=UPI00207A74E0|nr:dihydrodipicolinate synthase family protein [Sinobaca sp. H24]
MAGLTLQGVIPPVITPFTENGDVDYDSYRANIEKWNEDDLSGYLALGSNSETIYLTEEEKLELISITVRHAKKGRAVLAGTGMESTRETIALTNKAAEIGAHAALILTPFYYGKAMSDEALAAYFTEVADHSDIPILVYNVPKFTHINVSAALLKRLSGHPNIIGMKDSSGNVPQLATFKRELPADFTIMVGTASALFPALALGIDTAVMALANSHPNECSRIINYFKDGKVDEARELYQAVFPINTAVTETYGIAGLKHTATLQGYKGGWVRKPLLDSTDRQKQEIEELLKKQSLPVH